ncbi:hypothetical protein ACWNYO_00670 [Candidatus Vidania fulgoroideorum]
MNIIFKMYDKQYCYTDKKVNILVSKKNKIKRNDFIISKHIFFPIKRYALFKVVKKYFVKKKSIKFKRRKRYKRIFGYKNYYILAKLIKIV